MRRTLLVVITAASLVPAFSLAADQPSAAPSLEDAEQQSSQADPGQKSPKLSKEEVAKRLATVEAFSQGKTISSKEVSQADTVVKDLANNPETAGAALLDIVVDKARNKAFRKNCADIFSHGKAAPPPGYNATLLDAVHDKAEDALLRIYAAEFLLRDKNISAQSKHDILTMAEGFLRNGQESADVRLKIMPKFAGDSKATAIMLKELSRGAEVGPTLWTLGKLHGVAAIPAISSLLARHGKDKDFPRSRAYLAIGEIGGQQAYDLLRPYFKQESDDTMRSIIVEAIGLSRDPRAKDFLLKQLDSPRNRYYVSALEGLRYLGDKSVIPTLEHELDGSATPYQKSFVKKTVDALQNGNINPEW